MWAMASLLTWHRPSIESDCRSPRRCDDSCEKRRLSRGSVVVVVMLEWRVKDLGGVKSAPTQHAGTCCCMSSNGGHTPGLLLPTPLRLRGHRSQCRGTTLRHRGPILIAQLNGFSNDHGQSSDTDHMRTEGVGDTWLVQTIRTTTALVSVTTRRMGRGFGMRLAILFRLSSTKSAPRQRVQPLLLPL